jgi:hypothetical protein
MTHIWTWSRNHQKKTFWQISRIFGSKLQSLECKQALSTFSSCASFWPKMTYIWTWHTRNHENNLPDQFLGYLDENWNVNIFFIFSSCDLVFDQRWPIFRLDQYFIETNILTMFNYDAIKTVTDRVLTTPCWWRTATDASTAQLLYLGPGVTVFALG